MQPRRISHLRNHTAALALSSAITELSDIRLGAAELELAPGWAAQMLAADDRHGSIAELVVQGDGVPWQSISGLLSVATYGMLAHRQLAHDGGAGRACPLCEQSTAMWHSALIDPVARAKQSSAGQLHEWARGKVGQDLADHRRRPDSRA